MTLARCRGFTLVEMLMTIAILGLLVAMAVPSMQMLEQRRRETGLRTALADLRRAIDEYKRAADHGRIAMKAGSSGYPADLDELVRGVVDQRSVQGRKIYFLRSLPVDPMLDQSRRPGEEAGWGLRSYASSPDEPLPGDDVFDVYSLSRGTGLNGVPYRLW